MTFDLWTTPFARSEIFSLHPVMKPFSLSLSLSPLKSSSQISHLFINNVSQTSSFFSYSFSVYAFFV